jgi:hypothetical protein
MPWFPLFGRHWSGGRGMPPVAAASPSQARGIGPRAIAAACVQLNTKSVAAGLDEAPCVQLSRYQFFGRDYHAAAPVNGYLEHCGLVPPRPAVHWVLLFVVTRPRRRDPAGLFSSVAHPAIPGGAEGPSRAPP